MTESPCPGDTSLRAGTAARHPTACLSACGRPQAASWPWRQRGPRTSAGARGPGAWCLRVSQGPSKHGRANKRTAACCALWGPRVFCSDRGRVTSCPVMQWDVSKSLGLRGHCPHFWLSPSRVLDCTIYKGWAAGSRVVFVLFAEPSETPTGLPRAGMG